MDGQVTWSDLGISCGKTWSEHSAATEEKTSTPCWKKLRVSQNQDFLYLDCRKSGNGQRQEPLTVMGGLSLGELTTLNAGEKPSETAVQEMLSVWGPHSVAEESRLSQILEVNPLPKYNLTAKACLGILRRAERRGKDLPRRLKAVLLMQCASGGGCDGGGKGALVQTEKSGTLGTGNDQTIFCLQGNGIDRADAGSGADKTGQCLTAWDCQSKRIFGTDGIAPTLQGGVGGGVNNPAIFCMATQQGGAELRVDDCAPTLTAAAGMSGNNQPVVAIPINDKATRWQGGGESRNHDGSGNGLGIGKEGDPAPTLTAGDRHGVMCAGFKLGNSEQARSIGYQEELSPTLNAECGGNKPAVVAPVVALDMTHACDVIRECGKQAPSLQARMGTGGNQVPLTYQMNGFGDYRAADVTSSCKQRDFKDSTDLVCAVDCRNFREGGEVNGTLQAKESGGQSLNLNNTVRQNMVVRRLTPMECERLQGFPDGWTDIGDWVKTDKRGREIKVKESADSPRYKALGNSIALPFWDWMLRRMSRYLPDGATLGSLFDGIAGFPLIWERIHGRGTARWASEIEPFPIAVTKKHFPEEE